jgi:hypothetical protein
MILPEIRRVDRASTSDQHPPLVLRVDHDTVESGLSETPHYSNPAVFCSFARTSLIIRLTVERSRLKNSATSAGNCSSAATPVSAGFHLQLKWAQTRRSIFLKTNIEHIALGIGVGRPDNCGRGGNRQHAYLKKWRALDQHNHQRKR